MTVTAIESVTRHKMRVSLDGEPAFVFDGQGDKRMESGRRNGAG